MSLASVLFYFGWLCLGLCALLSLPLLTALGLNETTALGGFLVALVLSAFAGGASILGLRGVRLKDGTREWFLLPVLAWVLLPALAALPFYFSGAAMTWTDAYFEAVSGLTTTGSTVYAGLESLPRSLLLWRALLQWMGGFGSIVLAVSLLSLLGIGGMQAFRSHMPRGKGESMFLRMRRVAKSVWPIYAGLTGICGVLLWVVGMPAFEALCHALSTLSTGGFSTRDGSIGAFDSPLVELVVVVFMVLGALNFTLHWTARRGFRHVYKDDEECRLFLVLVVGCGLIIAIAIFAGAGAGEAAPPRGILESLRVGLFSIVSALSTTGYTVGHPVVLPLFPAMVIMGLMLFGGSTGSTAGGLKLMRVSLLLEQSRRELARLAHPHGVVRIRHGDQVVSDHIMAAIWTFFVLYILSIAVITIALSACGLDFFVAMSMAGANMANAGPVTGFMFAEGYAALPDLAKYLLCAAMVLGRLEILMLLTLINPAYWLR